MLTFYGVRLFDPQSKFPTVTMNIVAQDASIPVTILYRLDARCLTEQNVNPDERKSVLEKYLGLLERRNIRTGYDIFKGKVKKEKETFAITKHVLSKLCSSITLSHDSFQSIVEQDRLLKNVTVGRLGMGHNLHGMDTLMPESKHSTVILK